MWDVVPSEQYFPAYVAGLAAELSAASDTYPLIDRGHSILRRKAEDAAKLARELQQLLAISFNQAGWLLGEVRYCVNLGLSLPAFSLWQQRSFEGLRFTEIARRVNDSLNAGRPSAEFAGWRVGDDPARSHSDAVYLRCDTRYRWASSACNELDLAWGGLHLDCAIRQTAAGVTLSFVANDQFGWLFPQAEALVERAIISAFAACRSTPSHAPPRTQARPSVRPKMEFLLPTNAPRTAAQKLEWIAGFTCVRHAKSLLEADRLPDAFDWCERASRRLPDASFCASVRAFMHLVSRRTEDALDDFKHAIQLDWRNGSACTGRASVFCVLGNPRQSALAECNAAIGQGFADAWLYELRGCICHEIGNFSQAEEEYTIARRLHAPAVRSSLEQRIRMAASRHRVVFPDFSAKEWIVPLLLTWRRHMNV